MEKSAAILITNILKKEIYPNKSIHIHKILLKIIALSGVTRQEAKSVLRFLENYDCINLESDDTICFL